MRIYTITLNPAFDVHAETKNFLPFQENAAKVLSRDVGGKGLNISRALQKNGVSNTAIVVIGKENGEEFSFAAEEEGLQCLWVEQEGRIRENFTLHSDDGKETRISFSGFTVDAAVIDDVEKLIELEEETIVTLTGSLPKGIPMYELKCFLQRLKENGAKIVIDSKSFTLEDILEIGPWLMKPNQEEVSVYFGKKVESFQDCKEMAEQLCARGVENVMISLGAQGALLATKEGVYTATPPEVQAISTIGAGDSAIAGFLTAWSQGEEPKRCLRLAVSFGTAACKKAGTSAPSPAEVLTIYQSVSIEKQ